MRRYLPPIVVSLLIMFATVPVLACGDGGPSEEEARAQLCDDLSQLDDALVNMQNLSADSTVSEAQEAEDAVEDALSQVRESAQDVAEARLESLDNAWDDLASAIQDLPSGATLSEAAESIQTNLDATADAFRELSSSLNCS